MTKYINLEEKEVKEIKKTIFTHELNESSGWESSRGGDIPENFDKVVYLGKCSVDGDMFACYADGEIRIHRGIKGDEF